MSEKGTGSAKTDAAASAPRRTPTWLVVTIAGAFGLFFAYAVWNALGNLIQALEAASEYGLGLTALGWFIWILAAVFPILAFGAGFALGYRRPAHHFFLVMLTALTLVAVFWLNVVAYTTLNALSLLG